MGAGRLLIFLLLFTIDGRAEPSAYGNLRSLGLFAVRTDPTVYKNGRRSDEPEFIEAKQSVEWALAEFSGAPPRDQQKSNAKLIRATRKYLSLLGVKTKTVPSAHQKRGSAYTALEIQPDTISDFGTTAMEMDQASLAPGEERQPGRLSFLRFDPMFLEREKAGGGFLPEGNQVLWGPDVILAGKVSEHESAEHELVHFSVDKDGRFSRYQPFLGKVFYSTDRKGKNVRQKSLSDSIYANWWSFDEMLAFRKSVEVLEGQRNWGKALQRADRGEAICRQTAEALSVLSEGGNRPTLRYSDNRWTAQFQIPVPGKGYLNLEFPVPGAGGSDAPEEKIASLVEEQIHALKRGQKESLKYFKGKQKELEETLSTLASAAKEPLSLNELLETSSEGTNAKKLAQLAKELRASEGSWQFLRMEKILLLPVGSSWRAIQLENLYGAHQLDGPQILEALQELLAFECFHNYRSVAGKKSKRRS